MDYADTLSATGLDHDYDFDHDHDTRDDSERKQPGSVVRAGWNLGPLYRIVAVDGGNAWIRELDRGLDAITPVERLHVA